jgi:hypothetical protein
MNSILFRDLLMNMLLGLVALVVITLASINPAAEADPVDPPGQLVATAVWPAGAIDVDLWVTGPDNVAVGYSNKTGKVWALLRDDLGTANDPTPLNVEFASTRGLPDGEYAVNVRCYGCAGNVPLTVNVEVRLVEGGLVWRGPVSLERDKDEKTAIRFRARDGKVVPGSENRVFKKMRGEW